MLALSCALSCAAYSQLAQPEAVSARSHSGQFIIHASVAIAKPPLDLVTNRHFVTLDLGLLTVSCERIKQILFRELGLPAAWNGKISLVLYPGTSPQQIIQITSDQFRDGWQYRVDLPNLIERRRYVRAMVQVVLTEFANRKASGHSAEIPAWLIEGFTEDLLASNEVEIILPPPQGMMNGLNLTSTVINSRKKDPLEQARKELRANSPLTFDELSWPTEEQFDGAEGQRYRSSAQLFVSELLRLKDGPACLRTMLAELPQHYNWQFAFLHGFHDYFDRPVQAEKWWSLCLVEFTGRDAGQNWSLEESWQKLDQSIRFPVQVRATKNELPLHSEVTLQTIIRQWDRTPQTRALKSKSADLDLLRPRVAPQLAGLVDDYRQTLAAYLQNRDKTAFLLTFRTKAGLRRATEQTLGQLDALDARREAMRPEQKTGAATADAR